SAIGKNGEIYVVGTTKGNNSAGGEDVLLTKFSDSGATEWTKQWGSELLDFGYSVVLGSYGAIYVTGETFGDLDGNTNSGGYDIFLTSIFEY
ncbi:MAG TPA: hypothetical protein PKG52_06390, partial [bacterium]|nr:hypothetical protein [bacterium]